MAPRTLAAAVTAVLAAAAAASAAAPPLASCSDIKLNDGVVDVDYDLSSLTENSKPYEVDDRAHGDAYDYVFDVCRPLEALPARCAANTSFSADAAAYQIYENLDGRCVLLGRARDNTVEYSFIDPNDPGVGVEMKYSGGTPCNAATPRFFTVRVYCDQHHHATELPITEPVVYEPDVCSYEVELVHYSGCPKTCLQGEKLCGGHGLCSTDSDSKEVGCFCYLGKCGTHCGDRCGNPDGITTSGTSATPALAAVVIVLVLVLLAVAASWFVKSNRPAAAGGGSETYGRMNDMGGGDSL